MNINNNTVLITGGGSGIGLALAKRFLKLDNIVIICGRDGTKLEAVKKENPAINAIKCDISDHFEVTRMIELIKKKFTTINVLINNAGIQYNYDFSNDDKTLENIDTEININLTSQLKLTKLILPLIEKQKEGAIINVSSALAKVPKKSAPVYCASKAGIHIFTKALRYQLENTSIKVFEIIPALVDTEMTKGRGKRKISPGALADEFIRGFEKDKLEVRVGKVKILFFLHKILPNLAERIIKNN